MIYGSSYSSSSFSRAGLRPGSPTADEIDDEGRPLLQYESQNFGTPRELERAEFGALIIPDTSLPVTNFGRELEGKMTVGEFLKKLETDHEPGLSNTQLMLINHDLKPGMALKFLSS